MYPRTSSSSRRLATLETAAEYSAQSARTIRRRIADGTLTGYRVGPRAIRVDLDEVDAMIQPIPSAAAGGGRVAQSA